MTIYLQLSWSSSDTALFIAFSTKRIPVLYIFGRESVDPEKCISAFKELFSDQLSHILVMYDVRYSHVIGEVNS